VVLSATFSPDSQRIVTGSPDGTFTLWEAASGKELTTLTRKSDEISSVVCSVDGRRILIGRNDGTATVWEVDSGKEVLTLTGNGFTILCAAFSPDHRRIVTGNDDGTIRTWDAANGKDLLTLKGHNSAVLSVAFSPDSQRVVTGSWDQTAKVWEAASGKELLTLNGHNSAVLSVAFSPDGQRVVTGSWDKTAKVWEAATAEEVAVWQAEERVAEQHLAGLQRERTDQEERQMVVRARESIKQWLILAPIHLPPTQRGAVGLDIEQIERESHLRPRAGASWSIRGGQLKWREVALTNEVIDFNAILGQVTEQSVAYAVCYLWSEAEQQGLQMLVGSDDEAKVYLNGKQIYRYPLLGPFVAERDMVQDITLNAGLNVLVFKVVNDYADWRGAIRFTDAQGNPAKGIRVTLNPEGKE
jgi:hypothetical protein